jgi:hypothetical protein
MVAYTSESSLYVLCSKTERSTVEWIAALVSTGSLVVAGLSVWLAMKDRGAPHRQHLYEKQVEAFDEVHVALNTLVEACQSFIMDKGFRLDGPSRVQLRRELSQGSIADRYQAYLLSRRRWALFLPASVQEALAHFDHVLMGISAPDEWAHHYSHELVHANDPQMTLSDAQTRITAALREGLGVEPLSKEIMQVVGSARGAEQLERNRAVRQLPQGGK